jgi:DNA repair protein RecO (recombination protein O)
MLAARCNPKTTQPSDLQFSLSNGLLFPRAIRSRRPLNTAPHTDSTAAILLRRVPLSDTSLILTWCSERCGKIKTVAKGARRPKSPFAGRLDLFFDCEIQFSRSRRSELHILREAVLKNPHAELRKDWAKTQLAAYFSELLQLTTEPEHAMPELYDLLQRALSYLERKTPNKRALIHFEAELARLLGIQKPGISAAVSIGRAYGRLPSSRGKLLESLPESAQA